MNAKTIFLASTLAVAVACGGSQPAPTPPPAGSTEVTAIPPSSATPPAPTDSTASAPPAPTASSTPAPSASTADTSAPPADATPKMPAASWDAMSHDQKVDWMKKVVMPKAKQVFTDYKADKYANMNCATCHGSGAKSGKFKMPNPELPKLSMAGGFKKHDPDVVKFMATKVLPAVADAIGEKPFDPATKQGFGCKECHIVNK